MRAQFALQRLFKGPDAPDAIALFNDVDSGKIKGIFGDDLGIAARLAAKRGTVRWELVPEGADAVCWRTTHPMRRLTRRRSSSSKQRASSGPP